MFKDLKDNDMNIMKKKIKYTKKKRTKWKF